ncbi:glycosyltransferase family 39 protein [Patescibacteria group bacterium]|nr:glycosyltransferase family 39 protein [Patescibacteria group bacterium]
MGNKFKLFRRRLHRFRQIDIYQSFAKYSNAYWLGVVLLVVAITRYIGRSQYLYSTDSALYALAFEKYDISLHQPQPPGYPLYILLGKLFNWVVGDANLALVLVSILFSLLATWAIWRLAKKIYGGKVAWIATLLFVSSPLVWFHGQVALTYIVDAFFAAWFGYYIYDVMYSKKPAHTSLMSSIILALGAGFRPTIAIFLLPLWLLAILRQRSLKLLLANVSVFLGVVVLWLIPEVILSGGIKSFFHSLSTLLFTQSGVYSFSIFVKGINGLKSHWQMIFNNLQIGLGLSGLLTIFWLLSWLVPEKIKVGKISFLNLLFWSMWIIPSLLFYLIVIFNLPGYLLIIFPAIVILVAKALLEFLEFISTILPKLWQADKKLLTKLIIVTVMICLAWNVFIYLQPQDRHNLNKPVHHSIYQSNLLWGSLTSTINREFNSQSTIIGINQPFVHWGFPQFQYYFPKFDIYAKIYWGFYNPDNKQWFRSTNHRLTLEDDIVVSPLDSRMVVIQENWDKTGYPFQAIVLDHDTGALSYYDLTDPAVRELVSKIKNIMVQS